MRRILAFFILASVKTLVMVFYRRRFRWTPPRDQIDFRQARLLILLNHTSLYEPLFLGELPWRFLWEVADRIYLPIAAETLRRPWVGRFYKAMLPRVFPVTRKSDESWQKYLSSIRETDLVVIAAEGRMKRPGGLDKNGKPMTIRGGVADIIERMGSGRILICHSGGLHHVQEPGQVIPKPFKTLEMDVTEVDVKAYRARFSPNPRERKLQMVADLQKRLEVCGPGKNIEIWNSAT